jgi:predicted kinase
MKLNLTLGVAGAGKSTFVNNLLYRDVKLQVLCLDDIRLALGDVYDIRTEPVVRMITDVMGRAFMERSLPIIVDSTCTSIKIAEMWCRLAKEYNYKTYGIHLDTPFDVCCDRRLDKIHMDVLVRQRDQLVDLLQFTDMFDNFKTVKF